MNLNSFQPGAEFSSDLHLSAARACSARAAGGETPFCNTGSINFSSVSRVYSVPGTEFYSADQLPAFVDAIPVGAACLDWLTLTTYDGDLFGWAVGHIGGAVQGEMVPQHMMQYAGLAAEHCFFGVGEQMGVPHYLVRLSGYAAHQFFAWAWASGYGRRLAGFNCTRVDVQFTEPERVDGLDLAAAGRELRRMSWPSHRGVRSRVDVWDNEDGLSTLYIGARTSQRFTRCYVKEDRQPGIDQGPKPAHLRYECEFKRDLAKRFWSSAVQHGPLFFASVLAGEIEVLPVPPGLERIFQHIGAVDGHRLRIIPQIPDDLRSLGWIIWQVAPALLRLRDSADFEVRRAACEFLEYCIGVSETEAQTLDRVVPGSMSRLQRLRLRL